MGSVGDLNKRTRDRDDTTAQGALNGTIYANAGGNKNFWCPNGFGGGISSGTNTYPNQGTLKRHTGAHLLARTQGMHEAVPASLLITHRSH